MSDTTIPAPTLAASLLAGDATFRFDGRAFAPPTGYQVGLSTIFPTLIDPLDEAELTAWIQRHYRNTVREMEARAHAMLADEPDGEARHDEAHAYVGSWRDPDTRLIHIDISVWSPSRISALAIARLEHQKAIWNWETMSAEIV